jgi:hypothetical protein
MIRIITMEREYGSGAAATAEEVAARSGWKPWDQLLTEQIARASHERGQLRDWGTEFAALLTPWQRHFSAV